MFKSFLLNLKPHNPALIEAIETAYSICFENVDSDETITNEYESRWGS